MSFNFMAAITICSDFEAPQNKVFSFPTKVCIVTAIVFPVVMYGCESWTVKKAECRRIDALNCGVGEDS